MNIEDLSKMRATLATRALLVNGVCYSNSAAKFWPTFLDDVNRRCSDADRVVMSAHGDGPLSPRMLAPEQALSEAMNRMDPDVDFNAAMQGIAAEIEAAGPPVAVSLSIFQNEALIECEELNDFLDSDVFPFLLVWLLEWCCFSESAWNRNRLNGEFDADDIGNNVSYHFRFSLHNMHLSEGLYQRSLSLQWQRSPLKDKVQEAS